MIKHGMVNTPTYRSWSMMLARCRGEKLASFKDYGGRGISVCDRWLDFSNFLADMGLRPAGTSLDRKNNNGNYERDNCRWATRTEQNKNSRHNVYLERNGVRKLQTEWADELGIERATISMRVKAGWTGEDIFRPVSSLPRRTCAR